MILQLGYIPRPNKSVFYSLNGNKEKSSIKKSRISSPKNGITSIFGVMFFLPDDL